MRPEVQIKKHFNIDPSGINKVCLGKIKQTKTLVFKYVTEEQS